MEQYSGMEEQIASFPEQLELAVEIGRSLDLPALSNIQNIYIAGMGGSAIGAEFVRQWTTALCNYPIHVAKGYHVPAWVGPQTLAIISSFSGNTEETLTAFETIHQRKAHIVGISSGGKLRQYALHHHIPHITMPRKWISPRANLGLSSVLQYFILLKTGMLRVDLSDEFLRAADMLRQQALAIQRQAEQTARDLSNIACVYIIVPEEYASVGLRFRQQLNENSKLHAAHFVIPEMHHNAIVGWKDAPSEFAVLLLSFRNIHPRNRLRLRLTEEMIAPICAHSCTLQSKGNSSIQESLYMVHLTDWISHYLALLRGVDPVEVEIIESLKRKLREQSH